MHNYDYFMTCTTVIPSISSTLKNLMLYYNLHSSYSQKIIAEDEIIHNILSAYVEPLLNYINHPALVQGCKLNLDAPVYEKK